jgi:hypothetical protein
MGSRSAEAPARRFLLLFCCCRSQRCAGIKSAFAAATFKTHTAAVRLLQRRKQPQFIGAADGDIERSSEPDEFLCCVFVLAPGLGLTIQNTYL